MQIDVVASGSKGNCYLISHNGETLILDIGVPMKEIKKALNWDLLHVSGICITHSHSDHIYALKDAEMTGLPIWKPYEESTEIQTQQFGNFTVSSFHLPHDGCPCVGYLVTIDRQSILYATDFEYIKFRFDKRKIDAFLIECNYQEEFMDMDRENYSHVLKGHCKDTTCFEFLKVNVTEHTKHIILCHLSSSNCDGSVVQKIAEEVTHKPVSIAEKGLHIEL